MLPATYCSKHRHLLTQSAIWRVPAVTEGHSVPNYTSDGENNQIDCATTHSNHFCVSQQASRGSMLARRRFGSTVGKPGLHNAQASSSYPKNSRRRKDDIKQFPYRRPIYIRHPDNPATQICTLTKFFSGHLTLTAYFIF
jgi:hypothetical protein